MQVQFYFYVHGKSSCISPFFTAHCLKSRAISDRCRRSLFLEVFCPIFGINLQMSFGLSRGSSCSAGTVYTCNKNCGIIQTQTQFNLPLWAILIRFSASFSSFQTAKLSFCHSSNSNISSTSSSSNWSNWPWLTPKFFLGGEIFSVQSISMGVRPDYVKLFLSTIILPQNTKSPQPKNIEFCPPADKCFVSVKRISHKAHLYTVRGRITNWTQSTSVQWGFA